MWELDYKENWAPENWCFWIVVLEKTLESPLDCKEIKPVHPKRNQSWIFIGRTDTEHETPMLWPPEVKNWLIWKDPDAGKCWGQEEKGVTEDEMVGWYHQLSELNGHDFEQTLRDGEGQGNLVCCSPWGRKGSDNWTTTNIYDCINQDPIRKQHTQKGLAGKNLIVYLKRYGQDWGTTKCNGPPRAWQQHKVVSTSKLESTKGEMLLWAGREVEPWKKGVQ